MRAESKPWHIRHWSRRATAWLVGATALLAGGSAAAVVASSGSVPHPRPAARSNAALDTKNALSAILATNPDVGTPVKALIDQGKLPKATYAGDNGTVGVPKGVSHPATTRGASTGYVPGPVTGDFTLLQMASLALSQGCSAGEATIAAAIGAAESAGNSGAQGDVTLMDGTWDWSEGLWQIRGLKSERGTGGLRDSLANADPVKNAKAMMAISSGCTDWTPWSTYNTGAYLSYLSLSKAAAAAAGQYKLKTGSYPPVGGGSIAGIPSAAPATSAKSAKARRSAHPPAHRSAPSKAERSAVPANSSSSTAGAADKSPTSPQSSPSATKINSKNPPSLPIKLPPLPTKTPTLPVKLPTTITVPPLPPLPTLPKLP